ncbi:MAG TPA: hypothetical protein VGD65_09430 [Chryseosolibacter sp.]
MQADSFQSLPNLRKFIANQGYKSLAPLLYSVTIVIKTNDRSWVSINDRVDSGN